MKAKLKNISRVSNDLEYLKEEYEKVKMWGDCPDGDLRFEPLMKVNYENGVESYISFDPIGIEWCDDVEEIKRC